MRHYVVLSLCVALPSGAVSAEAAQRIVVVENFTNVHCTGCNVIKDSMDSIFEEYEGQVIPIRYHVNWPAPNDPFYLWSPDHIEARRSLYSVNSVPVFRYDGEYIYDPSDSGGYPYWYAGFQDVLDSLLVLPSKVRINLDQTMDEDSIYAAFDIIGVDSLSGSQLVYLAVTVRSVSCELEDFQYVFRDFVPDANGHLISLIYGDSLHFEWSYPVWQDVEPDNLITIIIVQSLSDNRILQAAAVNVSEVTGVAPPEMPVVLVLGQNRPNPFNPETRIAFRLDRPGPVRLSVYTLAGRLVTDLVNERLSEGAHSVTWYGRDVFGRDVGSGLYYYRLDAAGTSLTKKMMLLR